MPPDPLSPGARAARRHLVGDAAIRRDVAKDALREGVAYADPDPAYVGHVPSSMASTEVDEAYMKMAARELLETQDMPEEEPEGLYGFDREAYDEDEYLDDSEQGGTLLFDEGALSAEADERGQAFAADEREHSHYFAED